VTLPTFVIVGAGRSGSTALHRHLECHPEVFVSQPKELHFFTDNWGRGLAWYEEQFAGAAGARAVGEATPSYLFEPEVPARMASVIPQARLVAILRNPVDRAYSQYWRNRGEGRERLSFADAIAAEPERLATGRGLRRGAHRRRFAYLARSRYLGQLQRLCEHFPRAHLLVLVFEADLRDNPGHTYGAVCRFLGVDDGFVAAGLGAAVNRPVRYRSVTLHRAAHRLPPAMRSVASAVDRANRTPLAYPPLDPALRDRLAGDFAPEVDALAAWLGRDLSVWSS